MWIAMHLKAMDHDRRLAGRIGSGFSTDSNAVRHIEHEERQRFYRRVR